MQDRFYGDNRDLVKWGTLLELAGQYKATHILQVLYYRTNEWVPIEIDGRAVGIAKEVIQHFRNAKSIRNLRSDIRIEILDDEFRNRKNYLARVLALIKEGNDGPGIIFLDPDTGLEPPSHKSNLGHVLCIELNEIWKNLRTGDVLVLYQHKTGMNNKDFINPKSQEFVTAISIDRTQAKFAHAPDLRPQRM